MGVDVHLMNILPLFNVSAFMGFCAKKSPTSATLSRYVPFFKKREVVGDYVNRPVVAAFTAGNRLLVSRQTASRGQNCLRGNLSQRSRTFGV